MTGKRMRLLVTGASGQVGGELVKTLASLGEVFAPLREDLDLANPDSIRAWIRETKPVWIVNAGAYTAVDKAETEQELAFAVNAEAPRTIGEQARTLGARVLHFSTDYVFNGEGSRPWVESDPTGPLSVYGKSKLAGEEALLRGGTEALIFRTSWVYGATGKNFLRTILKLAREREELCIVDDQHGAPTWSRDLARMAAHVIASYASGGKCGGVYHAAGAGETTWAGFAAEAVRQLQSREPSARFAQVTGITTAEYPAAAPRPANSRLDCGKLKTTFDWTMMHWKEALAEVVEELTNVPA